VEGDEALGFRKGERAQQRGIEDTEDRGGGAQSETQGEHGDRGEAGTAAQTAEGEAEVASQIGEPSDKLGLLVRGSGNLDAPRQETVA
jgi:hypothetical protein